MAAILYKIPDRHINGFTLLINLSEEKRQALLEVIRNLQVGEFAEKIIKDLSITIHQDEQETRQMIDALAGLMFVTDETTEKLEPFIKGILDAYKAQSQENNDFDEAKIAQFLVQFIRSSGNYRTTLKANQLKFDREKILMHSRILTDIRPIFDEDDGRVVLGSIVMHNLSLDFSENGEAKKVVFAIDADDIRSLQKNLQRALDKEISVKDLLKDSALRNLDV